VEFKRSKRNGCFYITEPTVGRPDTQEGIFLSAGLDVPYLAYLDAIGQESAPLTQYKGKVKWINEPLIFYNLKNYFSNYVNIRDMVLTFKGRRSYALLAWDDLLPISTFILEKTVKGFFKLLI
jgi:hypothetical protein